MLNSELMFKELRYLTDKKITKVCESCSREYICLHFEGGNFCVFGSTYDRDFGTDVFLVDEFDFPDRDLLAMELITQKESDAREQRDEEHWVIRERAARLATYKKLQAEFEGVEQ